MVCVCGETVEPTSKFCNFCGTKITASAPAGSGSGLADARKEAGMHAKPPHIGVNNSFLLRERDRGRDREQDRGSDRGRDTDRRPSAAAEGSGSGVDAQEDDGMSQVKPLVGVNTSYSKTSKHQKHNWNDSL